MRFNHAEAPGAGADGIWLASIAGRSRRDRDGTDHEEAAMKAFGFGFVMLGLALAGCASGFSAAGDVRVIAKPHGITASMS